MVGGHGFLRGVGEGEEEIGVIAGREGSVRDSRGGEGGGGGGGGGGGDIGS